ncbi:amidase [Thermodesulfobacteriota bacterium]
MGGFKEYDQYDALGLAELLRKRDVSPVMVCDEAIKRIEEINPKINAVVTLMFDRARKLLDGRLPNGPFAGVPFLLKDLLAEDAGVALTNGSNAYRHYVPAKDSELVRRYKQAGLVILGKTNTPEFGLMGVTEPRLHGPTRNPWNTDHTPGGSSGGSAAAIASGMVPMASGGDGGGSIRIPAACCGLFGLKPSRGRNPTGPKYGEVWQGAVVEHVLTRSVRDSAAALDATHGSDPGAPYVIAPPARPSIKEVEQDPGSLKVAFNTRSPIGTDVHPECVRAVEDAAHLLEELGHRVEEAAPGVDGEALAKSYLMMYFGEVAADIEKLQTVLGRRPKRSEVEPTTWTLGLLGRSFTAGQFVTAMREWNAASRAMGRFHQTYDVYLTPTLASPPVRVGELGPKFLERMALRTINLLGLSRVLKATGMVDKLAVESLSRLPFTQLANLTGQPAMSVPLFWTAGGLPCGVHFMAPFAQEATLIRLAAQLERARPWFDKRPPMVA